MPAIICQHCSKPNLPEKRFCVECGQRLELLCSACGAPIAAAERFCGNCGARVAPASALPRENGTPAESPITGERRHLTVLFADLVSSTQLATRLDPEEYHHIVQAYHQAVARVVGRYDGYVAQYQGDGVVAYFGWPRAHGDDAERAVRAGLEIIEAIKGINRGLSESSQIAVRAGIDTGPVMVGHLGGGERREITAIGETPNIASRAQAAAPSGGLAITGATSHLVTGLFALEPLGFQNFKGVAQPIELFRVLRASGMRSRLHAAHTLTPFIGRQHELQTLGEWWNLAEAGEGQVVLIHGEPGIGKSRLVWQFRESLTGRPHSWLESFCSPFEVNTPFAPVANLITASYIWTSNDSAAERFDALEQSLGDAGLKLEEAIPLIAELVNLPLPDRYQPLLSPPEQRRRRLISVVAQWTYALAGLQPLVLLLEDLQWADPSSLELHHLLVEECAKLPLMLIYTARPKFTPPWPARTHHSHLMLARLSGRHTREMARLAVARAAMTDRTLDLVVERTDGVPLFVEELARVVAETGGTDSNDQQIPVTLADSLMARIDRLGTAKEIVQIAAVIGRGFSYALLREIAGKPDGVLLAALDRVVESELIGATGGRSEASYVFKHVMVRDTAYGSLLKSRRRELHRAVARTLSEKFAARAEAEPEVLAYHLTEAGQSDPAAAAWQQAADRSAARGAFAEAASHYSRALEVLSTTPASEARDQREMTLLISLGSVLTPTKGLASREVENIFRRARELGGRLGQVRKAAMLGLWQSYLTRGELAAAQELAQQRLEIAEREGAPLSLCWGHFAMGATLMHRGLLAESLTHLRAAVEQSHNRDSATRPFDAGVLAMSYLAVALMAAGFPDQARDVAVRTMRTAEQLAKPSNIAFCAINVAAMHQLSFNPQAALAIADSAAELARTHGVAQLASALDVYTGWGVAAAGNPSEGADRIRRGIAGWLADGGRLPHAWYLSLLGWTYALDRRFEEAEETMKDAAAAVGELHLEEPIVLWTRADILRMAATNAGGIDGVATNGGADSAALEAAWRAAIESARAKAMRLFELRSTVGLARLLGARGETSAAREMLGPLHDSFREGADSFDLVEAKRLLSDLAI
jgi:class 3 adenylate cyclase/tetratricopeptide (TPR) repeat protein